MKGERQTRSKPNGQILGIGAQGFGLKVFSGGNGGRIGGGFSWDKDFRKEKETTNAKIRSWRQTTLEAPPAPPAIQGEPHGPHLPADVEWVGGL